MGGWWYSIPIACHGRGSLWHGLHVADSAFFSYLSFCLGTVHDIVNRGGRCLIPVFALGRAQELLLILGMHISLHTDTY